MVVSQREPSQTPWAPSARAGGDLLPAADAAGREDGQRRHGVDRFGREHHGRDLAGVSARLVALRDDDVDARVRVFTGVPGAAREGGDEYVLVVGAPDDVGGR